VFPIKMVKCLKYRLIAYIFLQIFYLSRHISLRKTFVWIWRLHSIITPTTAHI